MQLANNKTAHGEIYCPQSHNNTAADNKELNGGKYKRMEAKTIRNRIEAYIMEWNGAVHICNRMKATYCNRMYASVRE